MEILKKKQLFNENGDIDVLQRRLINGNPTNLNDFNTLKYNWVSSWYRQAMNNFWIPEEVNLCQDVKDYRNLNEYEKKAYDKIISFLVFLDSLQTANLSSISTYITANEVNLCLCIQQFQEALHSQSYSYMLDTICNVQERQDILYQWKNDKVLLERNKYIGEQYNAFQKSNDKFSFMKMLMANYILEGIYFYSGFMFFYNLARNKKMNGSANIIRYINRDENTHLWLFHSIIKELSKEEPDLFTKDKVFYYQNMIKEGVQQEIKWARYVIGNSIEGLNIDMITSYIKYLGNLRSQSLDFDILYPEDIDEPDSMRWVSIYSNANMIKTDFFEAKSTAYAKASALIDDL